MYYHSSWTDWWLFGIYDEKTTITQPGQEGKVNQYELETPRAAFHGFDDKTVKAVTI